MHSPQSDSLQNDEIDRCTEEEEGEELDFGSSRPVNRIGSPQNNREQEGKEKEGGE